MGAKAGVCRTLLTHFSQRYPRVPIIDGSYQHTTCIAFDLMTLRLGDLPRLPALVPRLREVFDEAIPEEDREGGDVVVPFH